MNIRAVDLQVLIPHATDVSKAQVRANDQNAKQQMFSDQLERMSADKQQQIQNTPKAEYNKLQQESQDRKHQSKELYQPRKEKKQQNQQIMDKANNESHNPALGQHIDIKL